MKNAQKGFAIVAPKILVALAIVILVGGMYMFYGQTKKVTELSKQDSDIQTLDVGSSASTTDQSNDNMPLTLYIHKEHPTDCGVTEKIVRMVPRTTAVADVSLKILFEGELAPYGKYKSVSIVNGLAKVMLESDLDSTGKPVGSQSSCQSQLLFAVLEDTLTQYPSIKTVELYSPEGKIEF